MSKTVKIITKIISVFLVVLMVIEASPTNALAAFVKEISGNADASLEETYNESRNFYYDCHSIDVGRAGTLSINDYTLTPSLSFNSIGIDGNIFPVDISMLYNSVGYRFMNEVAGYTPEAYGDGWLTSYTMQLCELAYADKTYIALVSPESVILFGQTDFDETDPTEIPADTTKWVPVSLTDSGMFIYKASDAFAATEDAMINGSQAQYMLFTENECLYFDTLGRAILCETLDTSTSNSVYYQSINGVGAEAIAKIVDGVGNEYRFTYTDGLLTKIKCYTSDGTEIIAGDGEEAAPLEMNFTYANGRLASAIFPDGEAVTFAYGSAGKLTTVTNIDGYKAEITYTDGYASKLSEYALGENDEYIAGNYIDISWDGNTRTFTSSDGEVQIKTFDDTGKILTIVDGDGNYLYGEPVTEEESSTGIAEEESTDLVTEEETTEEAYTSVCPCSDCTEWECSCECESEDVCECVQCKRFTNTVEDESGNVLAEENFDGTKTMKTQNTYTSDGNYLSSSVDTSGNIVYYVYDEAGFLDSMTSGDMEVLFDYDAMGNLTKLYQNVRGADIAYDYDYYGVGTMSNVYTYTDDKVTSITHNGFSYNFTYDEWGNQTSIKIGENIYQSYEYDSANDYRLTKINYANGQSITYSYDENDNITGVSYDNGQTFAYLYEYDSDSVLTKVTDNQSGLVTTYTDSAIEIRNAADNSLVYSSVTNEDGTETETVNDFDITYTYNSDYNQVTGKTTSSKSLSKEYFNPDDMTEYNMDMQVSTTTDWFNRIESKNISMDVQKYCENTGPHENYIATGTQTFTYADTETTASTEITSHSSSYVWNGNNFFTKIEYYEYDDAGNITGIYRIEDDKKVYYHQYTYDTAGQMYSEYNYLRDEYIIYLYDFNGNITTKNIYPGCYNGLTHMCDVADVAYQYSYEDEVWGDKLTNYNYFDPYLLKPSVYYPITYDAMGNITSFNGSTLTWTAGRQLATLTDADGAVYSFTYNENGYLSKIVKSVDDAVKYTEHYTWNGEKLINYRKVEGYVVDESYILYDEQGEAYGLIRDEIMVYLFNRNLQGDITEIIEPDFGFVGAEYRYDAYGNYVVKDPESSWYSGDVHAKYVDRAVPFTYRGYLDINIGDYHLYYLGSRFYSPQLGRFINADIYVDTGTGVNGTNMFAYCDNNPIMRVDFNGTESNYISVFASDLAQIYGKHSVRRNRRGSNYSVILGSGNYKKTGTVNFYYGSRINFYKQMKIPYTINTKYYTVSEKSYQLKKALTTELINILGAFLTRNVVKWYKSYAVGKGISMLSEQLISKCFKTPGEYKVEIIVAKIYSYLTSVYKVYDEVVTIQTYKKQNGNWKLQNVNTYVFLDVY